MAGITHRRADSNAADGQPSLASLQDRRTTTGDLVGLGVGTSAIVRGVTVPMEDLRGHGRVLRWVAASDDVCTIKAPAVELLNVDGRWDTRTRLAWEDSLSGLYFLRALCLGLGVCVGHA